MLQRAGHEVVFPEGQTCCGQPAFNSGYREEAAKVLRGTARALAEAEALFGRFQRMITAPPGGPSEQLGKLTALSGVRQFPIRVKCASLPWHTLKAAIENPDETVSTE